MSESQILAGEWREAFSWRKGIRSPEECTVFVGVVDRAVMTAIKVINVTLIVIGIQYGYSDNMRALIPITSAGNK